METLRLATRGSDLARRQAASVAERLETRHRSVEIVEVETRGDRIRDELIHRLGRTGAFVRALDERVLDGDVDAAVHSMKDVPTEMPDDLVVAGAPERASARDALVTPDGRSLDALPDGAVVGTASLRRGAQLQAVRPDLSVMPLRGNVDTRVEKLLAPPLQREHERRLEAAGELDGGDSDDDAYDRTPEAWFEGLNEVERRALERDVDHEFDAIVLAEAGLQRLGLAPHVPTEPLAPEEFVPAPGQGSLAVTARDGELAERLCDALDHPPTRVAASVERTVLAELGGGCVAPMGVYARVQGPYVRTVVGVLSEDGSEEIGGTRDLSIGRHPVVAREFAADLRERGAAALIEQAKRDPDDGSGPSRSDEEGDGSGGGSA
jgi:hydroxymethylbilane synthase